MFKKLLVANRGEIAIRIFRTATQLGIKTAAIYSYEDRLSLHRFKADEAWQVGAPGGPVKAYLDIPAVIKIAKKIKADAIHPGYGFLSENTTFAAECAAAGITFVGPSVECLSTAGDKDLMRKLASSCKVPVVPGTDKVEDTISSAKKVGFPLIIKAVGGGGGRGMRVVHSEDELEAALDEARSEAQIAFGNDQVIFEKLVVDARHIEVQLLGDGEGRVVHLFDRDCSVQRRHQKILELAPALNLPAGVKEKLFKYAVQIGEALKLRAAATAEFLVSQSGDCYFIEVNPRIQVEHTVTEEVTGIDVVESQLKICSGEKFSFQQEKITCSGAAMQCRITTEDPEKDFQPDYGRLTTYRSVGGLGVRLDAGSAFAGAEVLPFYDSMLVKVTTRGKDLQEAGARMRRALMEFRVRGVSTNIGFLRNLVDTEELYEGKFNVNSLKQKPELFKIRRSKNRANRLLSYIAEVTVNGHESMPGIAGPQSFTYPQVEASEITPGFRTTLLEEGKKAFLARVLSSKELLFTDTTFRDAHQSLFATRVRSHDLLRIAPLVAERQGSLFSLEMWGGATFDVMMRFLKENPWERLERLREVIPNVPFQMLFRGANAVGYSTYDSKVVSSFVKTAHKSGIDIFRIFDSLNNSERMELAIKTTIDAGAVAESCICYTGDVRSDEKYNLDYYLRKADKLIGLGSDIIAIKDMAGLLRPSSAGFLVKELKKRFDVPIHFHTHDTAGLQTASYLQAAEAGVDIVDCAISPMSGLTSQPPLESVVKALEGTDRQSSLEFQDLIPIANYWERVSEVYQCFSSGLSAPTGEVYEHEMPGGQYSNLRAQSIALGKGEEWPLIKTRYKEVDKLFGRITKVTPSSKVVGDLALYLVAQKISTTELLENPSKYEVPGSVSSFLQGDLGHPEGGFPAVAVKSLVKESEPKPVVSYEEIQKAFNELFDSDLNEKEFLSYALYPKVYTDFRAGYEKFGDLMELNSKVFFFGMSEGEELVHDLEPGKRLFIKLVALSDTDEEGVTSVFFELNGQTREFRVASAESANQSRAKASGSDDYQVGSPYSGIVSEVYVEQGEYVEVGALLASLEAMKMQTNITAAVPGVVENVLVKTNDRVEAGDLLVQLLAK